MYLYDALILIVVSLILYLYWSFKKTYSFFEKNGIPHLKPSFPFGNMSPVFLLRSSLAETYQNVYRKLEPHKFGGIFVAKKKVIMIRDPEIIKNVLIKDFQYFQDRGMTVDQEMDPLGYHLFSMKGNYDFRQTRTIFKHTRHLLESYLKQYNTLKRENTYFIIF